MVFSECQNVLKAVQWLLLVCSKKYDGSSSKEDCRIERVF